MKREMKKTSKIALSAVFAALSVALMALVSIIPNLELALPAISGLFVTVIEFLDSLDIKMRQKMLRSIQALQDMGISLRMPLSESLDDGIFELRAKTGTNISRVMYFFVVGDRAVLTHGFIKKTQKTPPREIKRAKKIRDDYIERFGRR